MEIRIRESVEADIESLGARLREADEKEVIAAGNENGADALRQSFARSSRRYSVDIDGIVSAMFGVVPDSFLGDSANVWFLGAPEMALIKKSFVKCSRQVISDFLLQYPVLWNHVDSRYTKAIRWLESCGAVFMKKPIVLNGVEFYGFTIRRAA